MAQKTNTELKVFLDSATDSYDKYVNLADKSGTVFFDRNRRAVYAEGVLITSDVVDVKMDGSKLLVKKVGDSAYTELADLAIPDAFVRFDATQNLTDTQKSQARTNIGAEAADATILKQGDVVNNLTSDSTTAPLSAAQGKVLKGLVDGKVDEVAGKGLSTNDYTNDDKTKLDGIEEGAQVNFTIKANQTQVRPLKSIDGTNTITIYGNLVDSLSAGIGTINFNLSHKYVANDKKIYFFNTASAPTNVTDDNYIFYIDTTDFIKDSFVNTVTINDDNQLVIEFNTESGKETITVDLKSLVDVYKGDNSKGIATTTDDSGATVFSLNQDTLDKLGAITRLEEDLGGVEETVGTLIETTNTHSTDISNLKTWSEQTDESLSSYDDRIGELEHRDYSPKVWSF